MKRRIELWSVTVLPTKFDLANSEITISGYRGPEPQRPSIGTPAPLASGEIIAADTRPPQLVDIIGGRIPDAEELTIGLI